MNMEMEKAQLEKTIGDLVSHIMPPSTATDVSSSSTTTGPSSLASAGSSLSTSAVQTTPVVSDLTYAAYQEYRSQHHGPYSNKSYLRWVRNGGSDSPSFTWTHVPPNPGAGTRRRNYRRGRGQRRGGSSGGFGNFYVYNS
ncbi:uncharacterized protein LOC124807677 isoform X2 [Hydra vulgaris]|uniref:uncharacterized protein LOC124807677 isoform X2 n=1 Tax=Hydra vulgaris TaxID=6087 RepID=UPI001F5FBACC|nr:uncharacterized protein LOC124807677 isoform X1 [Hydra vulgaris]XP_047128094.1 uncharacterized protein LOC124808933 isoform X3 [Hydra vulgaris]